jgi:predicted glycosyltransferase
VPALVLPYSRQREQPLRVEKLKPYLPIEVLDEDDLEPGRLAQAVERGLHRRRRAAAAELKLEGAATAARIIEEWLAADPPAPEPSASCRQEMAPAPECKEETL